MAPRAALSLLLQRHDHVDTGLVTAALKGSADECIYKIGCKACAYNALANAEHVCIVVHTGQVIKKNILFVPLWRVLL